MAIATKEQLLAKRNPNTASGFKEEVVPLPELGVEVVVRGLSRLEAMHVQGMKNTVQREIETIAIAMVDPKLTASEIRSWMGTGEAGEFEPLSAKIQELSKMHRGAAKEVYENFEDDPDAEFRVPPGGDVEDDGGAAGKDDE